MTAQVPTAGVKRRRTNVNSIVTKFQEDGDIWEKDGNVVIGVVEDSNESESEDPDVVLHLFKCHTIILSQHSPVFRDMLAMPPSSSPEDMYNGLPLVRLPDPHLDIKELLRMLYDPIGYVTLMVYY